MNTTDSLKFPNKREFLATVLSQTSNKDEEDQLQIEESLNYEDFEIASADFEQYNQLFESHVLFKHSFQLEKQKYKMALQQSVQDVIKRLPLDVLEMNAEDFMSRISGNPT